MPRYNKPNPRRGTQPSYLVISGQNITTKDAQERLKLTPESFRSRRRIATRNLKPGESLTWEMLER